MCRQNSYHCALLAAVLVILAVMSRAAGDEVAAYLEDHGLGRLRAVYLEERLAEVAGEEREAILLQLASVYARLLETTDDPQRRDDLERRSRELLSKSPRHSADELRLALLRGTYRSAELIAEKHRLRIATVEELEEAKELLAEVIPDLSVLSKQLTDQLDVLERRQSRSSGSQATEISEEMDRTRRLNAQCMFLNAWAL